MIAAAFDIKGDTAGPTAVRVGIVLVVALVARAVAGRLITRLVHTLVDGSVQRRLVKLGQRAPSLLLDASPEAVARRNGRAATLGSALRSGTNLAIFALTLVTVLQEVGVNLAPIVASAGVVGIAIGFGAQQLVRDLFAGLFILAEDQYGVGDVVDVGGGTVGTVESVGLRVTRLRDVTGTVWHLPNGTITKVGNKSQGWSRVVLDVQFGLDASVADATGVLLEAGTRVAADPDFSDDMLDTPRVWGVETLDATSLTVRLAVQTRAARKDDVARALRSRVVLVAGERTVPLARSTQVR